MTDADRGRLCRSFLTSPAATAGEDSRKYLDSALTASGFAAPDWFSPDLEDATAPGMKAEGLENTVDSISEHGAQFDGEIWPRIQWDHADGAVREMGEEQVRTLAGDVGERISGFTVPKVGGLDNVKRFEDLLVTVESEHGLPTQSLEMNVIIESATAVSALSDIAEYGPDSRLVAFTFGPGDFTFDCGGRVIDGGLPEWASVREAITTEAAANDLLSIGGIFAQIYRSAGGVDYYNGSGFAENAERDANLGFDGSWSLHPQQTVQANRIHMPSPDDLRTYLDTIHELNQSDGSGSMLVAGGMVDVGGLKYYVSRIEEAVRVYEAREQQALDVYGEELIERALPIVEADVDRALELADYEL